jgi:hypothetical protein
MKYTMFYFQPDDMQKDLVTLDNEQKEEDFEKEFEELLKGFIERSPTLMKAWMKPLTLMKMTKTIMLIPMMTLARMI